MGGTKRSLDVVDSFIVNAAEEFEGDVLIEEGSNNATEEQ
jgi:hypothetical protein